MRRVHFDLKFAFLGMTNVCLLAWALSARTEVAAIALLVFAGFTWAWYGITRRQSPLLWGCIGGVFAVVAFVLCFCGWHISGYFYHDMPDDYFEDGAFTEVLVYPVVYCLAYGPIGAIAGLACGWTVLGLNRWLHHPS
jgi:hypothetical protein